MGAHDVGTTPPWHANAAPASWLVTALLALAVAAGAVVIALIVCGRWRPRPMPLAVAGAAVAGLLALLPPIASADPLSYAAYGHMAVTGHDPYRTRPAQLAATDPVAAAVEPPWQQEPSVYGPLATGEQALAAALGGDDPARIVLVLDLLGMVAFVGVGVLLLRAADDELGRSRAAGLWLANPLMWMQVVAGAHLDVLLALAAVAAMCLLRRGGMTGPATGGGMAGAGALVKPTGGLVWLAVAWQSRRSWRHLGIAAASLAVVVLPAYAAVGTGALHQLARAGRRVSHATPWRVVLDSTHAPRALIGALALVLAAALALALVRRAGTATAPVVAVAVTIAYVLAAPYALPWYDALPWALLPLVAASWRDWVLLTHTAVLSLAYLPGRDAVRLHGVLHEVAHGMRSVVTPVVLLGVLVAVLLVPRVRRQPAS